MPFNQQMTIPVELSLRPTDEGIRVFAEPVREIERLRQRTHTFTNLTVPAGDMPFGDVTGDLFELRAEFELSPVGPADTNPSGPSRPATAESFGLIIRGIPVTYDVTKQALSCRDVSAPLKPHDGRVRLHILVDRGSLEIFANSGRVALSVGVIPPDDNRSIMLMARGGPVQVRTLDAHELKSAWQP
jgi:fructan beta-fructosidase